MKDNSVLTKVSDFIRTHRLLKAGDRVIVALSGGADSVALLHILISFKEEYSFVVSAAHFHHGIRGEEADRDEMFVRELCAKWGIPLSAEKADVPAEALKSGESVETCARRLRYAFLERLSREHDALIATAHQRDDSVETMLWNLTRGSGLAGLGGIPVQRDTIIRPLLCLSRAEIEAYCRENALKYVTDSTNLQDEYTRNRLRHQVVPVLRKLNPAAEANMERTAQLMREADEYFNNISVEELKKAKTVYGYSCEKLLRLDPILLKYSVKRVLEEAGAPVDFDHIALIIGAMPTGGAVNLTRGFTATCTQGILRVYRDRRQQEQSAAHEIPFAEYSKTHGTRITVRGGIAYRGEENRKINNLYFKDCIPCAIITGNTVIRTRRAGDTFTDARRGVTKTLKKLMNELKLPRELRDTLLVAADGSNVLWIQGVGAAAQWRPDMPPDGDYILIDKGN